MTPPEGLLDGVMWMENVSVGSGPVQIYRFIPGVLFAVVLGPVSDYQLFSEAGHAGFSLAPLPEKDRVTGSSAGS